MRRQILCYVTDRNSLEAATGPTREAACSIERILVRRSRRRELDSTYPRKGSRRAATF